MIKRFSYLALIASSLSAQGWVNPPTSGYPTLNSFLQSLTAAQTGSGVPSVNCTTGKDLYFNTATSPSSLYYCDSTNHWTLVPTGVGVSSIQQLTGNVNLFTVNPQTSTYTTTVSDFKACSLIPVASGTFTITLVASGSQPPNGQCVRILNYGSGVVTVAPSGQNINGTSSSISLAAGSAAVPTGMFISSDGSNYEAQPVGVGGVGPISNGTNDQTVTSYTFVNGDCGKLVSQTNASAVADTLPTANSGGNFLNGCVIDVQNYGAGTITITPATTIDGSSSTLALTTNQGVRIYVDGGTSGWKTQRGIGGSSGGGTSTASQLLDFQFSTAGAVLTIGTTCSTGSAYTSTSTCNVRFGNQVYKYGSSGAITATLSGTSNTSLLYVYVDSSGNLTVGHNTTTTVTCANCSVATSISAFPAGSIPIGTVTFTANSFTGAGVISEQRAIYSRTLIVPGTCTTAVDSGASYQINLSCLSGTSTIAASLTPGAQAASAGTGICMDGSGNVGVSLCTSGGVTLPTLITPNSPPTYSSGTPVVATGFSITIPANTLSSGRGIEVTAVFNGGSSASDTGWISLNQTGATTTSNNISFGAGVSTNGVHFIRCNIWATATNVQGSACTLDQPNGNGNQQSYTVTTYTTASAMYLNFAYASGNPGVSVVTAYYMQMKPLNW